MFLTEKEREGEGVGVFFNDSKVGYRTRTWLLFFSTSFPRRPAIPCWQVDQRDW